MKNALTAARRTLKKTLTGNCGATNATPIRRPVIATIDVSADGEVKDYRVENQAFSTYAKARTYSRMLFAHENGMKVEDWI